MLYFSVYMLIDPRTDAVRWVGCSKDVRVRVARHLADRKHRAKAAWLDELKSLGLGPKVSIFLTADERDTTLEFMKRIERGLIRLMEERGEPLLNRDGTSQASRTGEVAAL